MTAKIEKSIFLRAAPEKIWAYLNQPDQLKLWFHESRAPLEAGKPYVLVDDDGNDLCNGEVEISEPHTRLVYSFTHGHLQGHLTRVEWTLEPIETGTLLRLTHDGFEGSPVPAFGMLCSHDGGWDKFLGQMRELAAAE